MLLSIVKILTLLVSMLYNYVIKHKKIHSNHPRQLRPFFLIIILIRNTQGRHSQGFGVSPSRAFHTDSYYQSARSTA